MERMELSPAHLDQTLCKVYEYKTCIIQQGSTLSVPDHSFPKPLKAGDRDNFSAQAQCQCYQYQILLCIAASLHLSRVWRFLSCVQCVTLMLQLLLTCNDIPWNWHIWFDADRADRSMQCRIRALQINTSKRSGEHDSSDAGVDHAFPTQRNPQHQAIRLWGPGRQQPCPQHSGMVVSLQPNPCNPSMQFRILRLKEIRVIGVWAYLRVSKKTWWG